MFSPEFFSNRLTTESRREFLQTVALGSSAALIGLMARLPRVSAEEARLAPGLVQFDASIEPLVKLIEDSPRDKVLERVGERIRQGDSYSRVLAALMLAAVRNVQPYPAVGFKFHAVLVINSCHLASLAGPDEDRWLPIFWAIDHFKSSQAEEARTSGWRMSAVTEAKVPTPEAARSEFQSAMDAWDLERADAATAGLVRSMSAATVFEQFAQYAARDFRSIGHKVIYLSNAWRTLQVIGWSFAEPIFRSLTLALLNHGSDPNPARSELAADQVWRETPRLIKEIPANWLASESAAPDAAWSKNFLAAGREQGPNELAQTAVGLLKQGATPQDLWDGVFLGGGELLMRQPGIVALHALTTANAMRFVWEQTGDDELRRRLLLQACAFNANFRQAAQARGGLKDLKIDQLQADMPADTGPDSVTAILANISSKPETAAAQVLGYLQQQGDPQLLLDASRRLIFLKGRDAHDYKFASAVLEDFAHVSPARRGEFLAASVFRLKGSTDRDSGLLTRTRAAVGA